MKIGRSFIQDFVSWQPQAITSSVWGSYNHFKKVVLEGIFPLHPLTSWMLSNLIFMVTTKIFVNILRGQIEQYGDTVLNEFGDVPLYQQLELLGRNFLKNY